MSKSGQDPHLYASPGFLKFTENKSQWQPNILYQSDFWGGRLFLEKKCFTYVFYQLNMFELIHPHPASLAPKEDPSKMVFKFQAVKINFLKADTNALTKGNDSLSDYSNYFIGNDKRKWASHVESYHNVVYQNLYPFINLKVYSENNNVKYDFILKNSANINDIKMQVVGSDGLYLKDHNLILKTSVGDVVQEKPFAYQMINGALNKVACEFTLKENIIGFKLKSSYNKNFP
ncbi:MAG TPA: hypothetical protein VNG53_10455, partial [Bacteroidia bacterium]|nr:hypothetical protein [Bacteroidia bacterium]